MNYLAHIYLSGDDPEVMIGGLLGDFVKGPLSNRYPPRIELGIALHRAIDAWFDNQPQVIRARSRFEPPFRRFGGVIVDICYDHLLAQQWNEHHPQPLPCYARDFYRHLQQHYQHLPEGAKRFTDNAPRVKLLEGYTKPDAIEKALERISRRLSRPVPLAQAMPQVESNLPRMADEFSELFLLLKRFASTRVEQLKSDLK